MGLKALMQASQTLNNAIVLNPCQVLWSQQYLGITNATFRFVDNANWDLAWSALRTMGYIKHDKTNLSWTSSDWWAQVAQEAQLVIGWFAHELFSMKLTVDRMEQLVDAGAAVLVSCPDK